MIHIPNVEEDDKSSLWPNLPYCGLYNESPLDGTHTNLAIPQVKLLKIAGQPMPLYSNDANKNLRLIGFGDHNSDEEPVKVFDSWRFITHPSLPEYRVKWSTSEQCNIGFYTPNCLMDTDPYLSDRRTLLIGKNGP